MFFSLAGRHDEYKSRALKIKNLDRSTWPGGQLLSCRFCTSQRIVLGQGETGSWLPLLDYFSHPKLRKKRRQ